MISEIDAQTKAEQDYIRAKADRDAVTRLTPDGMPRNTANDYERHLYARRLKLAGYPRESIRAALINLGLADIPSNKMKSYVDDVLNSIIVGFNEETPKIPPSELKVSNGV